MGLYISELFVNRDKHAQFGESDPHDTGRDTLGKVFKDCAREYGRCVSRVYVDRADGKPKAIGWVFEKRMRYEDARSPKDTYMREVWVTVHTAPPTKTIEYHYAEMD